MESFKQELTSQQRLYAIRQKRMYSSKHNPILKESDLEFLRNLQKEGEKMLARKDAWED